MSGNLSTGEAPALESHAFESNLTRLILILMTISYGGVFVTLASAGYDAYLVGNWSKIVFAFIAVLMILITAYSGYRYMFSLIGYHKLIHEHAPEPRNVLEEVYDLAEPPRISVLVPAYKEPREILFQTLMAAALAEYPRKQIVLLIDDPFPAQTFADAMATEGRRHLPIALQAIFDDEAAVYDAAHRSFEAKGGDYDAECETHTVAALYERVACWHAQQATRFIDGRAVLPYHERFFVDEILLAGETCHRARAEELRVGAPLEHGALHRHYRRLSGLFTCGFMSFERKRYANLSAEVNKAMNINSYLHLQGRHWREVEEEDGLCLREAIPEEATLHVPEHDYLIMIDADTLLKSDYAIRLVHEMQQPEHEKTAVMLTSPRAIPGCPKGVARLAGAGEDQFFRIELGCTYWNGGFWQGSNAVVRAQALRDIARETHERGHRITVAVQSGTVIEDTETTLDLLNAGWRVFCYPARLAYHGSPPDFGSLLIQRRRWASGLLLLPKLMRYAVGASKNMSLGRELFARIEYLVWAPLCVIMPLLWSTIPFGEMYNTVWLLLATLPRFALQLRVLKQEGYRLSDFLRLSALDMALIPVLAGGVLKSFQQAITGGKVVFARTPKLASRTAVPGLYAICELLLPVVFGVAAYRSFATGNPMQLLLNLGTASLTIYALVCLVGVRETIEDIAAGLGGGLRRLVALVEPDS